MFVNLSNRWEASSISANGSPMIRLVLNDEADSIPSSIDDITRQWTYLFFQIRRQKRYISVGWKRK